MSMIKKFDTSDYEELRTWYHGRNLEPVRQTCLPRVGFICPGIAAGFLVQTDAGFAILEGYVSNPFSNREVRFKAINDVTAALLQQAKDLGFDRVMAFTDNKVIPGYCDSFGFKFISKDLVYCKEI